MNKRTLKYVVHLFLITLTFQLGAQRALDYVTYTQRTNMGFNAPQIQKLNWIISNPLYLAHYYVNLQAIPTFSTDGFLWVNIPRNNVNIINPVSPDIDGDGVLNTSDPDMYDPCVPNISLNCNTLIPTDFEYLKFYPKRIEIVSPTEYTYYGELDPCDWKAGYVTIIAKDGQVFGQINYENDVYEIIDLGSNKQVMVYLHQNDINDTHCGVPANSSNNHNPSVSSRAGSSICETRILVLYLDEAEKIADPASKAKLVIQQSNDIASNSKANATFSLAGVVKVTGLSTTTDASDFFESLRTNQTIKKLRDSLQADLVGLFTNRAFQNTNDDPFSTSIIGWSGLQNFGKEDYGYFYCNIDKASAAFTFTHEASHDFGCLHDRNNTFWLQNAPPPFVKSAQGHSFFAGGFLGLKKRRTVMAILGSNNDGSRIMHLSNPDVKYKDNKTGVINERNNAAMLSSMACIISGYRPYVPPFSIYIIGPDVWSPYQTVEYCIEAISCDNPTSISWSYSNDGIHYTSISSNSLCVTLTTGNTAKLFIRAFAVCNGTTSIKTIVTYNANDPHVNGDCWGNSAQSLSQEFDYTFLENPISGELNIEIDAKENLLGTYIISDLQGIIFNEKKSLSLPKGKNLIKVNLSNIYSGTYIFSLNNKSKKFIKI